MTIEEFKGLKVGDKFVYMDCGKPWTVLTTNPLRATIKPGYTSRGEKFSPCEASYMNLVQPQ